MELYYLLSWRTFSQQHLKSKMLDESIILHIYWNCTCSTLEYLIMLIYMESVGKSCVNSSNLLIVCVVFYSGFVTDIFILLYCITFSFCVAYFSPWSSNPYKDCAEKNVLGGLSLEGFLSKVFCLIRSYDAQLINWWLNGKILFVNKHICCGSKNNLLLLCLFGAFLCTIYSAAFVALRRTKQILCLCGE